MSKSLPVPLSEGVLVQVERKQVKSEFLVIPESAKDDGPPEEGTVLLCGPECYEVNPGNKVFFRKFAGTQHPVDPTLVFLDESEVLAVLEDFTAEPPHNVVEWVVQWLGAPGTERRVRQYLDAFSEEQT